MQCLFYKASQDIINNCFLQIGNLEIELKELEFYFFDNEKHRDIYVHKNELQKTTQDFLYVHEKWGNYGGIDLTFGNGEYYGGILIRGIKLNHTYIAGPVKVRKAITSNIDAVFSTYDDLQSYFKRSKDKIGLRKRDNINNNRLLHSVRCNLGKKEKLKYRNALYRFVDEAYLLAKNNNNFKGSNNLKEVSKLKAISSQTLHFQYNEPLATRKIQENQILMKYIKEYDC